MPGGMMQKASFPASALFGDHHVLEVRRILLALPGVVEVYASSCFRVIEVSFEPDRVSLELITSSLEEAGYLANFPPLNDTMNEMPNRRTVVMEQTRATVAFQQDISIQKYSAWPCPGMGLLEIGEGKHG
jgi:hypothetical protein